MSIPKSGYTYPNKVTRIFLRAMEDVMGKNGVSAVLNLAGLRGWIESPPADDLERGVDFAEFSSINAALEEMYGPRGGRGLARRSAWATFDQVLADLGPLAALSDMTASDRPPSERTGAALRSMADIFTQISDQRSSVEEAEDSFTFTIHRCPVCWGRRAESPACAAATGLLEEALRRVTGGTTLSVEETRCVAVGDEVCAFRIAKQAPG